jgi:hypothetical protein
MFTALHTSQDHVIQSAFVSGKTNFGYALENIYPLLDRFGPQRKAQNKKFYDRLRTDIVNGCIMPPITLAFVSDDLSGSTVHNDLEEFINDNIATGYILDGMQRMITLNDASLIDGFDAERPIYVNVIVASRFDLLLYRMITLNNGQKPMTARHQIEMLTEGAINLSGADMRIVTEKQTEGKAVRRAFRKSDISEAYTAFISNSLHNQNSKIIETKLDEILVGKVMESEVASEKVAFSEILTEVSRLQQNDFVLDWIRQLNNLIGFTLGAKKSLGRIQGIPPEEFVEPLQRFEAAFDAINPSKVNVGKYRRELASLFFARIDDLIDYDKTQLEELFFDETMTE